MTQIPDAHRDGEALDGEALDGKVALVTGGSRGLGREMTLAFAAAGADVVIASRKSAACVELADEVRRTTGRRAMPHAVHVGSWDGLTAMVEEVYREFGRLDVLVNNAGIAPLYPSLEEVSEELFDKVIQVNLKGPFRLTALAGARMARAGGGSVINVSSVASVRPTPEDLPYAAAKAGLNTLTAGFAQAFGPAVRVNTIMAGPFFTDIARGWDRAAFRAMADRMPLRRGGEPHEIVGAALYLAGPASGFTTGAVLNVDGGQSVIR